MTRSIITIALAAAMAACGGNAPGERPFGTDSVAFDKKTHTAEVALRIDYPNDGPATLKGAIGEYISEQLGGTYGGPLASGDSVAAFYGERKAAELDEAAKDVESSAKPTLYFSQSITVAAQTGSYVTYTDTCEQYLGGAHGISAMGGVTFRKSDGRRFGHEMLRNTDTEAFRQLLKEGLRQYFSEGGADATTDKLLAQMLLTEGSVDYLPLPKAVPYLMPDGVAFVYQPYEIAPYAAGSPSFTIPYDKARPFLTQTVLKMVDASQATNSQPR